MRATRAGTKKTRSEERAWCLDRVGRQAAADFDRGPAISQMMKPNKGNSRTRSTHPTFDPVDAFEPTIETSAQIMSASKINPPSPVISIPIVISFRSAGAMLTPVQR